MRAGRDAEIRPPHPADLIRIGPDMDERQLRLRRLREAVGLADGIGHPLAERHHQIGLLHLADQRRRHPDPHIAAEIRVRCIEQLRPAMRWADRHYPFLGQSVEIGERRLVPHRLRHQGAADQHQRPLGARQHIGKPVQIRLARPGGNARPRRVQLGRGLLVEDVLRQDHRHRARCAALGDMKGAGHRFRGLLRLVDLDDLFRHVGQEARIVLLLQREAAEIGALDLADQHHHRRRVVIGRMQ